MIINTSTKKQKIYAAVSTTLIVVIIFVTVCTKPREMQSAAPPVMNQPAVQAPTAQASATVKAGLADGFHKILQETSQQLAYQDQVDKEMLSELNSGRYSFESPLVTVDPYNQSPLSAMVLFTSEKPLNISIHIEGGDVLSDIYFTFSGYNTKHMIPVYGLFPSRKNLVTLFATDEQGEKSTNILNISTEPLPDELSKNIILTDVAFKQQYQPGLNFTYAIKTAFDAYGKYRWFLKGTYLNASLYTYKDHFIVAKGNELEGDVLFFEINPLGRIYRVYYAPYGVHHDITENGAGNLLVTGSSGGTIEDFIYEINTKTGGIENSLDLKNIFQRSRVGFVPFGDPDWLHLNAIVQVPGTGKIIISSRHQSLLAQISWPEGKIDWILSEKDGWLDMFKKYLLTPIGKTELPYNQHAPEILPDQDNDPDTMDILLFDNGNQRFGLDSSSNADISKASSHPYSRLVQYRINFKKNTVQQVWEFNGGDEPLFSYRCGDANLLPNGNRLGMFLYDNADLSSANANYIEVSQVGKIVWQANAVSKDANGFYNEYRSERMNIYNDSANDLQLGNPAANMIPSVVYEKYGMKKDGLNGSE